MIAKITNIKINYIYTYVYSANKQKEIKKSDLLSYVVNGNYKEVNEYINKICSYDNLYYLHTALKRYINKKLLKLIIHQNNQEFELLKDAKKLEILLDYTNNNYHDDKIEFINNQIKSRSKFNLEKAKQKPRSKSLQFNQKTETQPLQQRFVKNYDINNTITNYTNNQEAIYSNNIRNIQTVFDEVDHNIENDDYIYMKKKQESRCKSLQRYEKIKQKHSKQDISNYFDISMHDITTQYMNGVIRHCIRRYENINQAFL